MTEIVLFHSVLGVRPGVLAAAERLRSAGHAVHVPDLYHGAVFDDYAEADAFLQGFGGFPELLRRTRAAVAELPAEVVYAGFSNGAGCAGYLTATRPGALGAVLMHGTLPLAVLGTVVGSTPTWPAGVPAQVHYGTGDAFRSPEHTRALEAEVLAGGGSWECFEYPVAGHLFADASLAAEYAPEAAELMWGRVTGFLAGIGRTGAPRTAEVS